MDTNRVKFMNTYIDSLTADEAIKVVDEYVKNGGSHYVVTPNADIVMKMQDNRELLEACNRADLILADGQIVVGLASFLGTPIKERVPMTDFVWKVLDLAEEKGYKVFLFGGMPDILDKGRKRIAERDPHLNFAGVYSPSYGFEKDEDRLSGIIDLLRKSQADILLVFLGCPKQELFLAKFHKEMGIPVSITMGGCIDFIGNDKIKRAPIWMQKVGLEWFFRFMMEPKRLFKRYFIDDMKIFPLALKYKLGMNAYKEFEKEQEFPK